MSETEYVVRKGHPEKGKFEVVARHDATLWLIAPECNAPRTYGADVFEPWEGSGASNPVEGVHDITDLRKVVFYDIPGGQPVRLHHGLDTDDVLVQAVYNSTGRVSTEVAITEVDENVLTVKAGSANSSRFGNELKVIVIG